MDSALAVLARYGRAAWRRRWLGVATAWLVCGIGWIGIYTIPDRYESSARLFVDADAILTPLLRGLAADSSPATQLEILQRTLLSRPNLEKLISKTDLDVMPDGPSERERLLAQLSNEIKVNPQTRNLFTILYRDTSPRLARDVVQTLLTIFIENATGGSRGDMENARRFLERQIQSYEQQLRAAEKRRADFRAHYIEALPADTNLNIPAMEGARIQVQLLEGKLQDALVARDSLQKEVDKTPSMLVVESGANRFLGDGDGRTRLQEAEDQLRILLLKDTDQHPDVIAQRKLIDALKNAPREAKRPAGAAGRDRPSADADPNLLRRSAPNPVYDQLKVKLIDADTNVVSSLRQRDDAIRNRDRLEKIQREQPGLVAEYENMDRDYTVLRRNYEELLGRLQSANIAQAADTQADKVKLQIIDPPEVPRLPVAPNRMLLVTGVLVVGLLAGVGFPVLFSQLDTSFSTIEDLRDLGLPVLGAVSAVGSISFLGRTIALFRFGGSIAALVCLYGGLLAHVLRSAAMV